jgi:hypothetical protein
MSLRLTAALALFWLATTGLPVRAQIADNASIWTLQDENASISSARVTDRFYVNGLRLGWTSPTTVVPDFLAELGRALWGGGTQRIGFDLEQQIYTPAETVTPVPDRLDRPYAGVLLGDFTLLSDVADSRSILMFSIGVVGPDAGAENVQNGFHDLIGQNHTNGWGYQIPNAPAIELLHERTWRLPTGVIADLESDALPSLTIGLGDLRDYVQVGVSFRIGEGLDSDYGIPRVRPGLSGGDAFTPTKPFAWYLFAGVDGQAVGYDMLLQAKPFRSGPHVSATWDVGEAQAGFAVMTHGMRLTFAYVAQTLEFTGQSGGIHQFGSAALSVRF